MDNKKFIFGFFFIFIFATLILALTTVTVTKSPAVCSGDWTKCSEAFKSDNKYATANATNTTNVTGIWGNYSFSINQTGNITNVTVKPEFFASNANGFIDVSLSDNGGSSFGPSHRIGGNTVEQIFTIDATSDFAWTPDSFSNANFKVKVVCLKVGGGADPTCNLDHIPVTVTYVLP